MGARQYPLVGGGSGGGAFAPTAAIPHWSPYYNPSPHADDDDFDDASIAGAWTVWNPGSNGTVTETLVDRLKIVAPSSTDKMTGIYKAAPSGSPDQYNITIGFYHRGRIGNFGQIGLFCAGNDLPGSPTTANLLNAGTTMFNNDWKWEFNSYGAYNSYSSTDGTLADGPFHFIRLHPYISANRISMLVSSNGQGWHEVNDKILSTASLSSDPAYFGMFVNNIGTVLDLSGIFTCYRVEISTDRFAPMGGWVDTGIIV